MEIFKDLHAFTWLNPTANNCNSFFINGSKKILIDPGHHHLFDHVRKELLRLSIEPQDIDVAIITHGHPDHIEGIKIFLNTNTLISIHQTECEFIRDVAPHYGDALGLTTFEPDILLQEGELTIGDLTFQVIHTPGHSPGSICLFWPDQKVLFTGDLVFYKGIGRVDVPGGSGETLKKSIKRISTLDVNYLLPGHGQIISGPDLVKSNFSEIERVWFAYL